MPKNRGNLPRRTSETIAKVPDVVDYNNETPKFCLRHLQPGFDVQGLSQAKRAAFAVALQKRATMTWQQIIFGDRHGLGTEKLSKGAIKPTVPIAFQDREYFLALRYEGMLPMVGARVKDVLHILWVEPEFGDLYNH